MYVTRNKTVNKVWIYGISRVLHNIAYNEILCERISKRTRHDRSLLCFLESCILKTWISFDRTAFASR